ncbi:hypothetical protein IP91_01653 [Pseudoduganella lurida]|uniref:DP-EP family protein n=1 Tax=Pseudoduganella lurida TaxID=1036180 RepID=A0A562REN9_9BURK|nr:hypothetical protein [Pseudoduganella lurida]TWI67539.1 hypothetical protein IP91_01653 [Pseudoduganella lurida]
MTITFKNIEVTAVPAIDPESGQPYVEVTLNPGVLQVTDPDTIVNYQLVDPTPADLLFTGLAITPENNQLSAPAISTDGRNLTINDINTLREDFTLVFAFNGEPAPQPFLRRIPDLENRPDL